MMDINNLHNKDLSQAEKAYKCIKKAILDLKFLPGQPISENEIADHLEMSRTPVREAIQRLKSEGLVETIPNRGNFVKVLSNDDIRQIYEMAEGLEGMVAYLAAQNPDKDEKKELLSAVEGMEDAVKNSDLESWVENDEKFHRTLHQLCGNTYLVDDLSMLYSQIHRVRVMTRRVVSKETSTKEHRSVYDAVISGNADLARTITQNHWRRVRKQVLGIISPALSKDIG